MKAVNNKTGIPIVQKPVQMVDIKDIRAFHERDDAGIDAKIADVRNGSYAPVILRNGGSGLYSLIEREAEFDAFEALHKNEEASKYTHIKAIVVNSEAEARDVFKSLKLGSYAPPSSRYVVADVLRNVRNDVEEAAASDDDDPIIYNGEIEYYISQGYKETLESLDTAEFESLLFGQCKLLETILGQFKSGLCESGNQDWPYKIKISNIAIRKSEIHDFNQLLGFFESNVIGLKGRFTKKGGKMKVENKKTGKIAHVVSASETHYNVKLDDGRRSRWVKTNCRIFDGYIDVDESGNVYDPQEKVAPAEDTIDVDPKETALEKKETSPPEVDAELIRDTVAMIDRILADGYLPLDRIISGYAEHWLENGIIRIGKVEGHEVYILNKREDVEVVRGLLEHFFKEELHEKGVVASIIPETSPLDDYIEVMDYYHRIAEQRDETGNAYDPQEKVAPAEDTIDADVTGNVDNQESSLEAYYISTLEKIADQFEQCNVNLQNISLDIEKISQAIPFPDEFELDPFPDGPRESSKASDLHADIVDYLVPGDEITLLYGRPQTGKTLMSLRIAESVASGKDFLGRKVNKGKVLFLTEEHITPYIKGAPDHLYLGKPDEYYFNKMDLLCSKADPMAKYDFIVVDTSYIRFARFEYWREYSAHYRKPVLFTMLAGKDHLTLPESFSEAARRNLISIESGRIIVTGRDCACIPFIIKNGEYVVNPLELCEVPN